MKRDWTIKALVVAGIIYVIAELFANSLLLHVTGGHQVSAKDVDRIETIMRVLSACGVVILVSNLVLPTFRQSRHRLKAFFLIACFLGPISYLSLQLMVNGIVGNASRADRDAGVMAYIYRMGMTNGGIKHSAELVANKNNPEGQALLASLGLYVFPGSVLGEAVSSKKAAYARVIFTAEMNRKDLKSHMSWTLWRPFDAKYSEYLTQYEKKVPIPSHEMVLNDVRQQEAKCIRYRARKDCGTPDFINSNYVKQEVNKKVRKQAGFAVVEDYWLTDRDSFRRAMLYSAIKAAKAKGKAQDVPYPMARQEFANSKDVTRWLSVVGFPYYFTGMGMSEYFWGWFESKPQAIAGLTKNLVGIDLDGYQAEQIYKSMIIPPIALFLSLFFATLNIISLLAAWITLRLPGRWAQLGVRAGLVTLAAVGPLFMSNGISQSEWYRMITMGMPDLSPVRYYVATWILQVEPFIGYLIR